MNMLQTIPQNENSLLLPAIVPETTKSGQTKKPFGHKQFTLKHGMSSHKSQFSHGSKGTPDDRSRRQYLRHIHKTKENSVEQNSDYA
jgi:hypothetical protein